MDLNQLQKLKPGTLLRVFNPRSTGIFRSSAWAQLESEESIRVPENTIVMFLKTEPSPAIVKVLLGEKVAYIVSTFLEKI